MLLRAKSSTTTSTAFWGEQKHLDTFLQAYAVEKAQVECRRKGHTCTEQTLSDGSIKLTVQVNGGSA
jgi:hypothetical protein